MGKPPAQTALLEVINDVNSGNLAAPKVNRGKFRMVSLLIMLLTFYFMATIGAKAHDGVVVADGSESQGRITARAPIITMTSNSLKGIVTKNYLRARELVVEGKSNGADEENHSSKEQDIHQLLLNNAKEKREIMGIDTHFGINSSSRNMDHRTIINNIGSKKKLGSGAVANEEKKSTNGEEKDNTRGFRSLGETFSESAYDDFNFIPHKDSPGEDLHHMTSGNEADFAEACRKHPQCVGFNSNGWLKHTLKGYSAWDKWTEDATKGFYIKKSCYDSNIIDQWACQPTQEETRSKIEESFTFFPKKDSLGGDIGEQIIGPLHFIAEICRKNLQCLGFNSNGWLKNVISDEREWDNDWTEDETKGFFLKKPCIDRDLNDSCPERKMNAECETKTDFMREDCEKTCGFCPSTSPSTEPTLTPSSFPTAIPSITPTLAPTAGTPAPTVTTAPSTALRVWKQIGPDIDFSGREVAMSKDGKRIAVASNSVRIYRFDENDNNWIPLGSSIDWRGGVSISDEGNRIVIGELWSRYAGDRPGRARIYKWNDIESEWIQMGSDIVGETARDSFGYSVSMSGDGSTVAIGAPYNDGNGDTSGHVRVYTWDETGSDWTQLGSDINGKTSRDTAGESVSISANGKIVAIGAPWHGAGHVRVYKWDENNDQWSQLGSDIDGTHSSDHYGHSISMSDEGNRIAIAGYSDGSGGHSGHVNIFQWDDSSNSWTQMGMVIRLEAAIHNIQNSECALSGDGSRVAVTTSSSNFSSKVRVYQWDNTNWILVGPDIDVGSFLNADHNEGWIPVPVSLSGNGKRLATAAQVNNGNGASSRYTRVYEAVNFVATSNNP